MYQYLNLLKKIKEKGTFKTPAREGLPRTLSLFGHQMRFDLQEGFPILTTKKISFKNIVTELLWFLKGDTNIKYLIDNGCDFWNEDAYNYYVKCRSGINNILSFKDFIYNIRDNKITKTSSYTLGDCGKQYGWLWRSWGRDIEYMEDDNTVYQEIDQVKNIIDGIIRNPESRRHIITAWNPSTLDKMALNACHSFVQFNCRGINFGEVVRMLGEENTPLTEINIQNIHQKYKDSNLPKYYLDCHLYQRSGDAFLGVPYNISSYSLLIHIIANICNMLPGEFIHSFGDIHIYEDHLEQVDKQLSRNPDKLPDISFSGEFYGLLDRYKSNNDLNQLIDSLVIDDFKINNYNPQPVIKAKLSTGLK